MIVYSVRNSLDQYTYAQQKKDQYLLYLSNDNEISERWISPSIKMVKFNVNREIFEHERRFDVGCLARDHDGKVIDVFTVRELGKLIWRLQRLMVLRKKLSAG